VTPQAPEALRSARRGVLALSGPREPLLAPMALWFDGHHVWMTTVGSSAKAKRLRRQPRCALASPAPADGTEAAVAYGTARVYGPHDPVGLAVHGAPVSAAMSALAARNAPVVAGYARESLEIPWSWLPQSRVALRMRLDEALPVRPPEVPPGVSPSLPTEVPAPVRRAVAGVRRVVVAAGRGEGLRVAPGAWSAGYALTLPAGFPIAPGEPVSVATDADPGNSPGGVAGLSVRGEMDEGGALRPSRVTWWQGFEIATVDIASPGLAAVELPD